MKIRIVRPHPDTRIRAKKHRFLLAAGRLEDRTGGVTLASVSGMLTSTTGAPSVQSGGSFVGKEINRCKYNKPNDRCNKIAVTPWLLAFQFTDPTFTGDAEYTLTATAKFSDETTADAKPRNFIWRIPRNQPLDPDFPSIEWPSDNDDISDDADDFLPYGFLEQTTTPDQVKSVSMMPTGGGTITAVSFTNIPEALHIWYAEFDTLPPATYQLQVMISPTNIKTVNNLVVD